MPASPTALSSASSSPATAGAFQNALGVVVASGQLVFQLSQAAAVSGGGEIAPTKVVINLDINGKVAPNQSMYRNTDLLPLGTTYAMQLLDGSGNKIADFGNQIITGSAPIDLSVLTPTSSSGTVISFPSPVFQNPTASQNIIQPAGTSFNVNIFEQTLFADQFSGADMGAKINAAIATAPATGCIIDATAFQGAQSAVNTININKPCWLKIGAVTLTLSGSPGINLSNTGASVFGLGPGATILQANTGTGDVIQTNAINVMAGGFSINSLIARTAGAGIRCKGGNGQFDNMTIDKTFNGIQITDSLSGASAGNIFRRIVMGSLVSPGGSWNAGIILGNVASGTVTSEFFHDISIIGTSVFADAMVVLDSGCDTNQFTDCAFAQSGTDSFCLSVRNTNTSNTPQWCKFLNCVFESGNTKVGVTVSAGILMNFVNCTMATCQNGFVFNGGQSIHVTECKIVGIQQNAIAITAGTDIRIMNNRISDTSLQTNGGFNSIQVSANVTDFSIIGNDFTTVLSSVNQPFNNISIVAGTSNRYWVYGNTFANSTGAGLGDGGTGAEKFIGFNSPGANNIQTIKTANFNSILWVDGTKYTTIMGAYADLPSTGGTIMVPPNYSETLSANINIAKGGTSLCFMGPAIITQGAFQLVVAAGTHNVSIISPYMHSTNAAGADLGVTFTGYTGVGTPAISIGTSSVITYNFAMSGINVHLGSAGAATVGIKLNQVQWFDISRCNVIAGNFSGQIGFLLDGTGSFCGIGSMYQNAVADGSGSTNTVAFKEQNACNDINYFLGHCTLHNSGTSIGLHLAGPGASSSEATLFGLSMDNCAIAIKVDTTESGALDGYFRPDSTVGTIVNFGAGTTANTVKCNNPGTVVDSGTNNSVIVQGIDQHNTRFWQVQQTSTAYNIISSVSGSSGTILTATAGGNVQLQSAAAGGAGFIMTNVGAISPNATTGSSDLGSFLPYRDLYLSPANSTTNSVRLTAPGVTGNKVITVPNVTDTIAVLGTFAAPPAIGNTTPAAGSFTTITTSGLATKYNNISTVSNGVPSEYATVDSTTNTANIALATAYAVPATGQGMYRVSGYVIVNRAATTSSTLPNLQIQWTDPDNSTVQSLSFVATSPSGNTLTTMFSVPPQTIFAKLSTNIQYQTGNSTAYASVGGTSMQYSTHLKIEAL